MRTRAHLREKRHPKGCSVEGSEDMSDIMWRGAVDVWQRARYLGLWLSYIDGPHP